MARLFEYQGKQILEEVGLSIPKGAVASTHEEAKGIAAEIGKPVAIKAQIWATGRFKAGGIRFAANPDEAERIAGEILGSQIKGSRVERVLVEEKLAIDR
ncbi:MAG: acetate--CoA ligase family protein [Chloroflexi bacterium]|nr:acetate--CoA ligase family protein [Chloroflexota bacterium]